ncbi:FGGY-family carbohydrate kinase [Chryseolinea lacunae]|uniref:Carbohydrate kinase n=1 Tax=Chryseolinea lacunae TaxID=2801331 RepID=A0ABS1KUU6_9BACT|nr:FGGY family carbohydrate kinase [Chryseolinea lacunae]MBL0743149.1 carbohydrate kinase [Chryseolinea lacunae]
MEAQPVILIFDVGKTNKKILLFDEHYRLVFEDSTHLPETTDEDGMACEDVTLLTQWLRNSFERLLKDTRFAIKAVNFSGYGASFVYLDARGEPVLPLYNYLKPYPEALQKKFYDTYGGEADFSTATASPVLGSLNSGMQLYRIKAENPAKFATIKHALHLPQYLSCILTRKPVSEITSIGCHTNLWDFTSRNYHVWVEREGLAEKFPPIHKSTEVVMTTSNGQTLPIGIGLHDSSAALIPYLANFREPFMLLSTGTWCISLNPFNHKPLTREALAQDGLCYLTYEGLPVKASRLFAGYEHEQQVARMAEHFGLSTSAFTTLEHDAALLDKLRRTGWEARSQRDTLQHSSFADTDLTSFASPSEAYHALIMNIVVRQRMSSAWVLEDTDVKRIFVDGGFSKNDIYMFLLAASFPAIETFAASVPQASALGAALVMHEYWNKTSLPVDLIGLKYYSCGAEKFMQ